MSTLVRVIWRLLLVLLLILVLLTGLLFALENTQPEVRSLVAYLRSPLFGNVPIIAVILGGLSALIVTVWFFSWILGTLFTDPKRSHMPKHSINTSQMIPVYRPSPEDSARSAALSIRSPVPPLNTILSTNPARASTWSQGITIVQQPVDTSNVIVISGHRQNPTLPFAQEPPTKTHITVTSTDKQDESSDPDLTLDNTKPITPIDQYEDASTDLHPLIYQPNGPYANLFPPPEPGEEDLIDEIFREELSTGKYVHPITAMGEQPGATKDNHPAHKSDELQDTTPMEPPPSIDDDNL